MGRIKRAIKISIGEWLMALAEKVLKSKEIREYKREMTGVELKGILALNGYTQARASMEIGMDQAVICRTINGRSRNKKVLRFIAQLPRQPRQESKKVS